MFGDYSLAELGSILVMQGFAGLILFSVFLLMALSTHERPGGRDDMGAKRRGRDSNPR